MSIFRKTRRLGGRGGGKAVGREKRGTVHRRHPSVRGEGGTRRREEEGAVSTHKTLLTIEERSKH